MELQHVNVKLYLENSKKLDMEALIPIFHRWIQEQACDELLIDVADYRHVYAGPGVVLVGHEANYSVDNTDNRLGLRYNRKAVLEGSNQDRFRQALHAALTACQHLEGDSQLEGQVRFSGQEIQLSINDRLLAPNLDGTYAAIKADLAVFFRELFKGGDYSLHQNKDHRSLFSVTAKASRPFNVEELIQNLRPSQK